MFSFKLPVKRVVREACILVLIASLLGFSYSAVTQKGMFASSAHSTPPLIHINDALLLLNSGEAVFIDARHHLDFRFGHIKGAINIPLADFDQMKDVIETIPKEKIIVVYCDGAACNSSIRFAENLTAQGFSNVKVFFGGWQEWENQNLPKEGEPLP